MGEENLLYIHSKYMLNSFCSNLRIFFLTVQVLRRQESIFGVAAGRARSRISEGTRNFSFLHDVHTSSGADTASGYRSSIPGIKRLGRQLTTRFS